MTVKHKNIKRIKMIMQSLEKEHGIVPGTLITFKKEILAHKLDFNSVDENKVVESARPKIYLHRWIKNDSPSMFIDVVYEPYTKKHLVRFLYNKEIVVITFKKGKTIKSIRNMLHNDFQDPNKGE